MKRTCIKDLYEWKNSNGRKPLILRGARQVGKTWLMKSFAEEAYKQYVYVNFEEDELVQKLFEKDFDIERILLALQVATGIVIDEETLIIFDELQEAPRGLTALKYFYEKAPQYHVMAAGSLLGIAMHENVSFPVGKVNFVDLRPLSFLEFLNAMGEEQLCKVLEKGDWELTNLFHGKLETLLRQYYYVGGMPEVVLSYVTEKNLEKVRHLQQNLLDAYDRDFSKHAPINEVPRIRMVWKSLPQQLAKENKKFIYGLLREGARAKDFELAIEWLMDAGLVYKVGRAKKGLIPLAAYQDLSAFKLFVLDVGLLGAMSRLPASVLLDGNRLFADYKGAFTEQFVFQQLKNTDGMDVYYWTADNARAEIDFLVQCGELIAPIEVKAEENLQAKSLRLFVENNPHLKGIRFSMSPYREQNRMTNFPLYCVNYLTRWL